MELKLGSFYFKSGDRLDYVANLIFGSLFALTAGMGVIGLYSLFKEKDSYLASALNSKMLLTGFDYNVMLLLMVLQFALYLYWAYDCFNFVYKKKKGLLV